MAANPETQLQPLDDIQNLPPHLDPSTYPRTLTSTVDNSTIYLELTYDNLNPTTALSTVSSPAAGANVLFLGTTRDEFENRPVERLSYTAYPQLALKSLNEIATSAVQRFGLKGVYITHRLGVVPVKEASIVVAVSAGHRGEAWRAAEEVLEAVKRRVEVWKREEFVDGDMEWRDNNERDAHGNLKELGTGM